MVTEMQTTIEIVDPVFTEKKYNALDRFFISLINDERDLPFIYLCIKLLLVVLPVSIYLFIPGNFNWWIAIGYYLVQLVFLAGPYILMLHNTSHRSFFKKKYSFLNNIIPWVIGPFFGETPESYFAHHLGMHHAENNLPPDHSSTMKFQRDSFIDFLKYYGEFILLGIYQLYQYLTFKKRFKIRDKFATGEASFWILCIALSFFNWQATLAVFVIPVFLYRFLMMAGNWGQHAFIDPADPGNNYRNSITCINSDYNKKCFNDGYHIGHHVRPAMHWTEMPVEFQNNIQTYIAERAIVFRKLDFFSVWLFLMLKRYNWLTNFYVQLDPLNPKSKTEIEALLKYRTRKFQNI